MPPAGSSFTPLNLPPTFTLPPCLEYFTLTAGPNTDLWRKPPNGDVSTAPIVFTSLRSAFVLAEVTVSADWEMECDQGGLVIFAGAAPRSFSSDAPGRTPRLGGGPPRPGKWVKAGMEFCSGTVHASSVSATADGADWCLSPLCVPEPRGGGGRREGGGGGVGIQSLRIKLERIGHALWIWYQVPSAVPTGMTMTPEAVSSTWKKLREVTWFFYGVEEKFVHVGVYASRPNGVAGRDEAMWTMHGGETEGLVVEFEDLEIF